MVDGQASLRHELLEILQTERKPAIPTHAGHNDDRLEFAFPELGGRQAAFIRPRYQIADATLPFYEIGYALALERQTILICRKGEVIPVRSK
jgi:hypothetical protein